MAGNLIQPYSGNTIINPFGPTGGAQGTRVSFQFWRQPVYQLSDGTYFTPGCDGPTYARNPWDYVYIGLPTTGQPFTPGIARVRVTKFRDVDKKKSAGSDGARVTIHGVEPAEVEIELMIWTPEQLRQLNNIWPTLFPAAYKGSPPAFQVQHPAFTAGLHAIKSLQFVKMEGPEIDAKGVGMFKLKAWEYLKPGTANATKTAAAELPTIYDSTNAPSVTPPGTNSSDTNP